MLLDNGGWVGPGAYERRSGFTAHNCFAAHKLLVGNAAGPPQRMRFAESSTERIQRLVALRMRKQQSQCTVEAKRAR